MKNVTGIPTFAYYGKYRSSIGAYVADSDPDPIPMNYHYSHTSMIKGYVSRRKYGEVYKYSGRFGTGYVTISPSRDSTNFCYISYFIE